MVLIMESMLIVIKVIVNYKCSFVDKIDFYLFGN